jgi:sarcosine oxidase subunit alpha
VGRRTSAQGAHRQHDGIAQRHQRRRPRARELLSRLTSDAVDAQAIPPGGLREVVVDNVPCLAIRVGFVGELSYELHHPSRQSETLWNSLLDAGRDLDVRPHGLDALKLLRLEKGHILIGQDTDFDTTPSKVGLDFAVKMNKPDFIGRTAFSESPPSRASVRSSMTFAERGHQEGAPPASHAGHISNLTSSASHRLGCGIARVGPASVGAPTRIRPRHLET